jgi:hypothetical protein
MKVKEPDFAVMSLVWRQAPALLAFSFLATLLLVSPVYGLQACDGVDPLVWLTLATLVAIHHHHFSLQAGSNRSRLSISPR